MLKQKALLTKVSEIVEEEVTLIISDLEFTGFANIVPYQLQEGNEYEVSLGITILDDFKIAEADMAAKSIEPVNDSFKYLIKGVLKEGGILDAGVIFQDDMLAEYEYLIGKYVEFEVDRISVEFLQEPIALNRTQ